MSNSRLANVTTDRPLDLILRQRRVLDGDYHDVVIRPSANSIFTFDEGGNPVASTAPTLAGLSLTGNPTVSLAAPAFMTFHKSTGGNTAKAYVGQLGSFEANLAFNMDYTDGVHQYGSDSTKQAVWIGMSGDFAVQYAPSGQTADIWENSGSNYLFHCTGSSKKMYIAATAARIAAADFNALLTVPRSADSVSISGYDDLVLQGHRTKTSAGDIYLNATGLGRAIIGLGGGSTIIGPTAAISTSATDGFVYVPTCAGVPTGVPTAFTGRAPYIIDTTNHRFYFYSGGSWRNAGP